MAAAEAEPLPAVVEPCAFTLMTYNLWKTNGEPTAWAVREPALRRQLESLDPDVLMVQELHPKIEACILQALPGHGRVADDFQGWQQEGNIFFRSSLFSELAHGCSEIGQREPLRRLFWARLQCRRTGRKALFATAHFTWQGHPAEDQSDVNLRKAQSRKVAESLDLLQEPAEPCFFGGDLNESFCTHRVLSAAGFTDCFSALRLPLRPTHPTRPCVAAEDTHGDQVLDWLFARPGAEEPRHPQAKRRRMSGGGEVGVLRPLLATVVRDMTGLSSDDPAEEQALAVQTSDHCPVMAVYKL